MRKILYIIILALVFFSPVKRLEISKLEPIEAVALEVLGNDVILKTDSGRQGRGATVTDAMQNLKENTPAVVYLDTARYLLISDKAQHLQEEIKAFLKSNIEVARYYGGEVKRELEYLQSHADSEKPAA